jgi:hypothetical protein
VAAASAGRTKKSESGIGQLLVAGTPAPAEGILRCDRVAPQRPRCGSAGLVYTNRRSGEWPIRLSVAAYGSRDGARDEMGGVAPVDTVAFARGYASIDLPNGFEPSSADQRPEPGSTQLRAHADKRC